MNATQYDDRREQPTPDPDLDYAVAQYHREKEARRDAQRERDALAAECERLRAALRDVLPILRHCRWVCPTRTAVAQPTSRQRWTLRAPHSTSKRS